MKKVILFVAMMGIFGTFISGCDMESIENDVNARVEEQQKQREERQAAELEEQRQEEERRRAEEEARVCDNNAFNTFAQEWNAEHPDQQITKEMVEEHSDLVGQFKFENIEVRMAYHEAIDSNDSDCYRYMIRDRKNTSLPEFLENAIPYMRDVYKLSDEDINTVVESFKSGEKQCYIGPVEYEYRENDIGNVQSITQYQ